MGGSADSSDGVCHVADITHRTSAFVIFIAIVVGSILFELLRHLLEHFAPDLFIPVIEGMWAELTILGFVALVLFQMAHTSWWEELSNNVFGDSETLLHIAEKVHFAVFWTMVAYLVLVFVLILLSRLVQRHWARLEASVLAVSEGSNKPVGMSRALMNRSYYASIRQEFITSHNMTQMYPHLPAPAPLPEEFDFSVYLYNVLARFLVKIVRLKLFTWAFLLVMFAAFYGISALAVKWQMLAFFIYGGSLVICALGIRWRLTSIVRHLTPDAGDSLIYHRNSVPDYADYADYDGNYYTGDAPHSTDWYELYEVAHPPQYTYGEYAEIVHPEPMYHNAAPYIQTRGIGPFANPSPTYLGTQTGTPPYLKHFPAHPLPAHRALFACGKHGVGLFFRLIQILLLLTAVYIAVFLAYFVTKFGKSDNCFATVGAVLIPIVAAVVPICSLLVLCDCSRLFCIATSIERMRKLECVEEASRSVKLRHTLQAMAMVHTLTLADGQPDVINPKPLPPGQATQLRHTFAKFDRDRSGYIDAAELRGLFHTLGQNVPEDQLARAIAEMDPSGEGIVTMDEFCSFVANHSASAEQQAHAIFTMIDTDQSGTVTVDEFMDACLRLKTDLTYDDVSAVVRSLDRDGSGKVDFKEFRRLYNRLMGV